MPRSFLVKKYFSNKKPYYRESQLESQTAFVPESFPLAELPTQNNASALTCHPSSPFFTSSDALPAALSPVTPGCLPPSPLGPLNLSSSPSSSSGDEEEDGGRTSDPPSPEVIQSIFYCLHCSKTYGSLSALSHHQVSSHQLPPNAPSSQTTSIPSEVSQRPAFHCKHCSKEYTSLGALKMHIRSHTLPCVCPTCGKAFSRPWLLRGHIRTHTGERPFACQHCNRAFADRSNLRAHLQTHSEVKKYHCSSCSRTFSRMSLLHKHNSSGCCTSL
ncbi:snail family zinc finger 1b [Fundulus diaphanus]